MLTAKADQTDECGQNADYDEQNGGGHDVAIRAQQELEERLIHVGPYSDSQY